MLKPIVNRLTLSIPLLIIVSFLSFGLVYMSPGSPAEYIAGPQATTTEIAKINVALGLNQPFFQSFLSWFDKVIHGNLGTSLFSGTPVTQEISGRFPITLTLIVLALLITIVLGIGAGVVAAWRPDSIVDRTVTFTASFLLAIPGFVLAVFLVYLFAVRVHWFQATGYFSFGSGFAPWLRSIVLPSIALGLPGAAVVARYMRTSMQETMQKEFIRTAAAKGLTYRQLIAHHAVRNAVAPVVPVIGVYMVTLLGSTMVIETILSIPGLGQLAVQSALQKDFPTIEGIVLFYALLVVVTNVLVDIVHAWVDPRVRR